MRCLTAATIQLDATPALTADRLARAERSISEAARSGAQLIARPEMFNTGYTYSDENFYCAETPNGVTATWMKDLAAGLNVHLAGSILLNDCVDIYHALLLFAPAMMYNSQQNIRKGKWGTRSCANLPGLHSIRM